MEEKVKNYLDKKEIIISIVLVLLAAGGFLLLFFCRDLIDFSVNTTNCATFPLAMLTFAKWLIIPVGIMMIASVAMIPNVLYMKNVLSKIILCVIAIAILGLTIYLYFFRNDFTLPNGLFSKIIKIFSVALVFIFILSALFLMLAAVYNFGTSNISQGVIYSIIIILIPFIQCLSSFLQTLDGFWWGLLAILIQLVPLYFLIRYVLYEAIVAFINFKD